MSDRETGGPAFPVATSDSAAPVQVGNFTWQFPGMTLRDYYAGKVLSGFLGEPLSDGQMPSSRVVMGRWKEESELPEEYLANAAFKMADAMIKARMK